MKRKSAEFEEDVETGEEELSPKELKKKQHNASVQKRKEARRRDKVARWGGVILLGLMMFVGFLLWVAGEMQQEEQATVQTGTIIVK